MASVPFDTQGFTRRLKAGGFSAEQAETMADALKEGALAGAATKSDLSDVEDELKRDIADVKRDVAELRTELKRDMTEIKSDTTPSCAIWRTASSSSSAR